MLFWFCSGFFFFNKLRLVPFVETFVHIAFFYFYFCFGALLLFILLHQNMPSTLRVVGLGVNCVTIVLQCNVMCCNVM